MAKTTIKLRWNKDAEGWSGMLWPMFAIFKDEKQLYLDVMDAARAPSRQHRQIKIDSIHQGKCIAAEMIKLMLA